MGLQAVGVNVVTGGASESMTRQRLSEEHEKGEKRRALLVLFKQGI